MRTRVLALALLAAAAAVHLLVTLPLQRQTAADAEAYRRARDERRLVHARLARLERAELLRRQAAAVLAGTASEDTVRLARRSVIDSLEGVPVSEVRLSVRPGAREQVAAAVTLAAKGEFEDVLRLAGQLARAGSGLVLRTVSFSALRGSVSLTVEAVGPAVRS